MDGEITSRVGHQRERKLVGKGQHYATYDVLDNENLFSHDFSPQNNHDCLLDDLNSLFFLQRIVLRSTV